MKAIIRRPFVWRARHRERRYGHKARHELAVCAIFRDEAPFLEEWIAFHVGIGVTHFFLYNNFSTDNFLETLQPWLKKGMVTLKEWPRPVGQLAAYVHCCRRHWKSCRWIALIDLDEFLFSAEQQDVPSILREYVDLPGIEVWQAFYGASGHQLRPEIMVTEAYKYRAGLQQTTVKSIVNPRFVYKPGVHQTKYWEGVALDLLRRPVTNGSEPTLERLRINHYWSRSIEDLHTKVARGDASTSAQRQLQWHLEFESKLNEVYDDSISPMAKKIFGDNV